ncbi:efflux RND transporter periplasmic adaptor subunit [Alteromonas sp. C1M14]|uniref:efflux RND transporter periplasmic adaptor subunit n=1 Tax=Alteromonas sp. C1M14 TaxID=2841567 RepID=UPI001C0881AC|nr:efflux RND transporter periplasmic adaptor subunit [Alteromonas sp. C1M14]MBU2979602.1 efflux RND transporter periplasmic adaptor subunit [Alteromonas sp. C1M14]
MKYFRFIGGLLALCFLLSGCEQSETASPAGNAPTVSYITVTPTVYTMEAKMQGRVVASREAQVRPQVTGIVKERLFDEGDSVTQGQVLYQLDPTTYASAYNEAKADVASAKASVETARLKDERYASLLAIDGVSQQDADDAHADYLEAAADIAKYEAALETAKINLEFTKIKAPISGRIGISTVTEGALVTAEQDTALATIRQLDPIYVDMTKSSKALLQLRKLLGSKNISQGTATVSLELEDGSDYQYEGQMKMQEVSVNSSTGAVTLRAQFSNPQGLLLPGMFVRGTVNEAVDENAILVPQQGIYHSANGDAFAYVINDANTIEKRVVKTLEAVGNKWLIGSGLSTQDKLLVEGSIKIRPDSQVEPVEVTMDASGEMVVISEKTHNLNVDSTAMTGV